MREPAFGVVACAPPTPPPTQLVVTTIETWCGGVIPPPGEPFCHSYPTSRTVDVSHSGTIVASGTSGAAGTLTVDVPAGRLVVSAHEVFSYMICDAPVVTAVAEQTTPVTQTCTIMAP